MNIRRSGNRFTSNLRAGGIGAGACVLMAAQPALSADAPAPTPSTPAQTGAGASAPRPPEGLTVHVDPKTGEFVSRPAPGTPPLSLTPEEQNAFSTSHQGLTEVPVAKPGGGYKLDLKGRFQSPQGVTTGGATGHDK